MHNYPVRAHEAGAGVGTCVSFSVYGQKNELFEQTRHFHGLQWLKLVGDLQRRQKPLFSDRSIIVAL